MKFKNIKKTIIFIIIFIIIFLFINKISNPSGTYGEWYTSSALTDYYQKQKNTVDILYLGSSNVYAGISPLEIYKKIGVTGYCYSSSEQKVWSTYYLLNEALKTQKPKVIFLETSEFFSDKSDQNEQGKRKAIDPLKLDDNTFNMMNDNIYDYSNFDKASIVIKILRYHGRWSKLNWSDWEKLFHKQYSYEGYIFDNKIKSYDYDEEEAIAQEESTPENEVQEMPDIVKEYLNKILQTCNDNGIKLVLLSMPAPKAWNAKKHNEIEKYSKENNLEFVDLNTQESLDIDWENDSTDSGTHLNIYGAEKIATYLANYIKDNFKFEDHIDDPNYFKWNDDLEKYDERKGIAETYEDQIREERKLY